ncbi:hypothetical protein QG37_06672 [Candidozyma auris]|uniref:Uncharacterized protein n=1 Tax=Candidozyma auris TaxID=498019 RepID=A0A0L0NS37_CANAR|nr:hypothetical protein QG37_06672 [[Candida] auris]
MIEDEYTTMKSKGMLQYKQLKADGDREKAVR